ncbi:MAG: helix-turn-helix transcriptional regulator [Polyangiales bacterium]
MPSRPTDERPSRVARQTRRFQREAKLLGLNIRALREALGLTLQEASERMDVAPKHLQKIEAGGGKGGVEDAAPINVTLVTLVRIADGLGTTVHNLFAPRSPSRK